MRIDIDLTEEDKKRVKEYAKDYGLRLRKAYSELIRAGLEAYEIVKIQRVTGEERKELIEKIKELRLAAIRRSARKKKRR